MEFTPYKIQIFSALANIQVRTEYQLGDLNFVTKKATNVAWQYAFTGSGWQHRALTEHLLHYGVIDWECITHVFNSCGSLPSGIFDEPLKDMVDAWADDDMAKKTSMP